MEAKAKGLTVLVIMTALCALVASASAPPTPFMIYGYVSYEDGSECDNPTVNINNTNTSNEWSTEIKTNASYNYYQLILANGSDVNANEILRFNVTSPTGNQSNITEHTVTQENITDGGLLNFNITLESPAAPTITDWNNNKTLNNSTAITINESECVFFNATADQAIDVWSWFVDGTNQSHNFDNFSYCNWTVNGTYYVDVNGTSANGTSNAITWTVTVNDTTPPEIVDHTPTGTNVPVTTNITATFSEAINPSTLNNETIVVENSTGSKIEGDITYTSETCTVTFDPVSNLECNETYNVTITTGVQDLAGNNMSSNYTWNFTTEMPPSTVVSIVDVSAPPGGTITVPIMVNNVTNLGGGEINVTFNSSIVHVTNVTGGNMGLDAHNINNASGWVYIIAHSAHGKSGDVVFANINLTTLGNETEVSPLNITIYKLVDIPSYNHIPHTVSNGTFSITDTLPPLVTNPTANPDTIPNNGTVYSQLNVTVTDSSGIASVIVNLSSIGGAPAQSMNKIPEIDIWTVTTNATKGYGLQNLTINATDNAGYSNTSVSIPLNITDATKPVPSNISANTTEAGMPVLFSAYWIDAVGLANYTFAWNDTGEWENVSFEMTEKANWSNVTMTLNKTPKTIGWRFYANDTSGNLNETGIQILTINDTIEPAISNASAHPATILNDNGRARLSGTNVSHLDITVIDIGSGIASVTVNLSSIGRSSVQHMTNISDTNNWTVTTNASSGINETNYLFVNATDTAGNSNTSVCIPLTVLRRGDVYRDNLIDICDILYIARYRAHLEPEWSNPPSVLVGDVVGTAGDPTGDGEVDIIDLLYIARYKAGLEDEP